MEQTRNILSLPLELRDLIWDLVMEEEDITYLTHTCHQIRRETLSRMPGGRFIDYENFQDDEELGKKVSDKKIVAKDLNIIAEPHYSPGSALKFEIKWIASYSGRHVSGTSRWTVRDLASPMTRYVYLFQPRNVAIVFEAPMTGHMLLAFLMLHAKWLDISRVLRDLWRDRIWPFWKELAIYFRGGKNPSRPRSPRKSFWEMRPTPVVSPRWHVRACRWEGKVMKRTEQERETYPYFYECLLLPIFSCTWGWVPTSISFDLTPSKRRTSFYDKTRVGGKVVNIEYFGYLELFRFARREYCLYLQERLGRELRDHLRVPSSSHWDRRTTDFRWVMRLFHDFIGELSWFLDEAGGREANQLRHYLGRMKDAHTYNPLARAWEAYSQNWKYTQPEEVDEVWVCWWETFIGQQYIEWAAKGCEKPCAKIS